MRTYARQNAKGSGTRVIIFSLAFSILFIVIGVKSFYLQVFKGPWLSEKAAGQYERSFDSSGKRGTIYDKNLREMAVSIKVTSVAAHPDLVGDKKKAATLLSAALGANHNSIYQHLSSGKPFVWIKRHVSPKEEKQVKDLHIDGIVFKSEYSRFYPNKTLGAQVLGFTGVDGRGLEGIEFSYDTQLKGTSSRRTVIKDALGRRFDSKEDDEPHLDGNNIVLTIDCTIQYIVEQALEAAVTDFGAKSGMALVMDPKTGALLAASSFPTFNPNAFWVYGRDTWRNRVITDSFEPGSTLKVFTAASAIDSGLCSPYSVFFCENGNYKIGVNVVHEAGSHSYGWLSLQEIIKFSSNIGAVKVQELIGPKILYHGLSNFGFGRKTDIDCIGETSGSLSNYRDWSRIDAGAISFGQGISVSALQLVAAASAIANNGTMMKPYLVQAITDINGQLIQTTKPKSVGSVISPAAAKAMKDILTAVLEAGGTGINAIVDGYRVCGKTGTAQKIGPSGTYEKGLYMSSFIGFVPSDDPALTILVVIDEPKKRYYGGTVAAPAFKKIAQETLDYLDISPRNTPDIFRVSFDSEVKG
jgi:cell division protein FtsI (penicillin-binding protein 3)